MWPPEEAAGDCGRKDTEGARRSFFAKVLRMPRGARDLTFVPGNIIKSFASRERARWKHAADTATRRCPKWHPKRNNFEILRHESERSTEKFLRKYLSDTPYSRAFFLSLLLFLHSSLLLWCENIYFGCRCAMGDTNVAARKNNQSWSWDKRWREKKRKERNDNNIPT